MAYSRSRCFERRTVITSMSLRKYACMNVELDVEAEQYRCHPDDAYSPLLLTSVYNGDENILHALAPADVDEIFDVLYKTFPYTKNEKSPAERLR